MDFSGVAYNMHEEVLGYGEHIYGAEGDPSLMAHGGDEHGYISQDNSGEFQLNATILTDGGDRFGVSAVHLDTFEELAWSANDGGHATSYYNATNTSKYTSFQVHMSEGVREVYSIDEGLLCLTPTSLHLRSRYGLPQYSIKNEKFENLTTMCLLPLHNRILLGGQQSTVVELDLETQQETNAFSVGSEEAPGDSVILRNHPRFVIHGETQGRIAMHDPRSMREEHTFRAHHSSLSDFDVQGNFIATCGFTERMGRTVEDQLLMVYDMRMMKLAIPLRCAKAAYMLRFVPNMSSVVAAVSHDGLWNMLDTMQPDSGMLMLHSNGKQNTIMPGGCITSMTVASSSQAVLFGDAHGHVHLWTQGTKPTYNNFSRESAYPTTAAPTISIPITDQFTPLGSIPLDIPDEPLLSDWPTQYMAVKYRPTPPIDPKILANMNMHGPVGYHSNTQGHSRNVVPYQLFRNRNKTPVTDTDKADVRVKVARNYRRLDIKYGKLGIDDFDFDFYNRTNLSGLDSSLPNSYCNAMLQMFYYLGPIRATLLSHLCSREVCLSCELGCLFYMLDKSTNMSMPCNAANFLRAFRTIPEASAMSLTIADSDSRAKVNLSTKIMSWNCFVLQQIKNELQGDIKDKASLDSEAPAATNVMDEMFGCSMSRVTRCTRCNTAQTSTTTSLLHILSLQETMPEVCSKRPAGGVSFSAVLEASMSQGNSTQAWCDNCNKYQPQQQSKTYQSLPNSLVINTGLDNAQDVSYWQDQYREIIARAAAGTEDTTTTTTTNTTTPPPTAPVPGAAAPGNSRPCRYRSSCVRPGCKFWHPGRDTRGSAAGGEGLEIMEHTKDHFWVPLAMRALLKEDGTVNLADIPLDEYSDACDNEEGIIYELVGVVSHVSDPQFPDKDNLIGHIKVGPDYHERVGMSRVANWYHFNDISINAILTPEAIWFPAWKMPCVLYWTRRSLPESLTRLVPINPINASAFLQDNLTQHSKRMTFMPLSDDELPTKDDVIAMDAEFVNLHQEEAEIRSDGTRTTIKPSHKAVARITCIRGQGPLAGTPFMDDYISTQEQVVDYLTQFSGIKPGDLDANYSQKHLTHLKSTYIKLRYLVEQGVKFVGHGLKNDFRVINMVVPPNQLLDTLHLFHMPHNRMLSLKFLAWHFLKIKIQSVTHDSIEDAGTALQLYQKYCELQTSGTFRKELEILYQEGKKLLWQVPGELDDQQ